MEQQQMKLQQQMEQQQLKLQQQQQQIEQQQLKLQQQQLQLQNTQQMAQRQPPTSLNAQLSNPMMKPVTSVSSLIVSDLVAKSAPHQNHIQGPANDPNDWREKERRWAQEELDREMQVSQHLVGFLGIYHENLSSRNDRDGLTQPLKNYIYFFQSAFNRYAKNDLFQLEKERERASQIVPPLAPSVWERDQHHFPSITSPTSSKPKDNTTTTTSTTTRTTATSTSTVRRQEAIEPIHDTEHTFSKQFFFHFILATSQISWDVESFTIVTSIKSAR